MRRRKARSRLIGKQCQVNPEWKHGPGVIVRHRIRESYAAVKWPRKGKVSRHNLRYLIILED